MKTNQSNPGKKRKTEKKQVNDLTIIDSNETIMSTEENEMLSLMIDEILKGVDIKTHYPAFYRKLFHNVELTQAFFDILESIESEKKGEIPPFPEFSKPNLAFLSRHPFQPNIQKTDEASWQIKLQKNIQQLQAIFFPKEPALQRSKLVKDGWTILKEETNLEEAVYLVLLECEISGDTRNNSLSAFLNIAITPKSTISSPQFPIYATLNWGKYSETIKITKEGLAKFPDIPYTMAFDNENRNVIAELKLQLNKSLIDYL